MSAVPVPRQPFQARNPPLPELTFETQSIALAAALAATQQLPYLGAHLHENGNDVLFRFDDPLGKGEELGRRFQHSLFPLVNPRTLTEAHRYLTEDIRRVKGVKDGSR